jgi:Kef-type K+ transport system membrane component KefB/voltage-gated potassium channel Kch
MSADVFTQLSLVLVVAAAVAMVMRLLKQPLLMGYILTGILVGPSLLNLIEARGAFDTFSEIGITLLLFIIGLELSLATVKQLGKPVFLTAMAILLSVGTMGYLLGVAFHFSVAEAVITGLALFFSSTIIIAKVLSDKKELTRLNGQIAVGVILLDDVVATFALLFVAAGKGGQALGVGDIGILVLKGAAVVGVLAFLGIKVLPRLTKQIAKSQELLFLFALAWGFGVATLVNHIGFSIEIGALFAGVTLAHLPYVHQIGARLKPLRDFFIILFFISLGESLQLHDLRAAIVPAIVLSVVVIFLKPLVVMTSLGVLRYTKRTSFKTGINLSQISEFSIILVVLAHQAGLVGNRLGAVITLVAIITISVSTYLMQYDNWIYTKLENKLHLFERETTNEARYRAQVYPLVLFGYKNGGQQFLKTFRGMKKRFVVVDYNPEVIEELERKHIEYLYGDATDPELLADIDFAKAKLIVNTIGDHTVNVSLTQYVRRHNKNTVIICYSRDHNQAAELYKLGASYVMLPHFIGSEKLNMFIHLHGINKDSFEEYRKKHLIQIGRTALSDEV